jgi:ABC-type dipeptide/oligopeptide/nickel transport system permease subunit
MRDVIRVYKKNKLAVFGFFVISIIVILAVFADAISPYKYDEIDLMSFLQPPSFKHPFGTDSIGRDLMTRIIYGARTSLIVGFSVQIIAVGIGVPLGLLAGFYGGKADYWISRLVEVMTAFPGLLFAIFLMVWLGNGLINIIIALGVTSWVGICRVTRAKTLEIKGETFVEAVEALGASNSYILFKTILPNIIRPIIVMVGLGIPQAIFGEASLSFLGFGISDPMPSWGKMIQESLGYLQGYWYMGFFPTLSLAITVLCFNFVADGLRDALDPRMYGRRA